MKQFSKIMAVITTLAVIFCFVGCTDPTGTQAPTLSADPATTEPGGTADCVEPNDEPVNRAEVSAGSILCGFENGDDAWDMFDLSYYDFQIPPTEIISGEEAQSGNALKIKVDETPEYGTQLLLVDPTDVGNSQGFAASGDYKYVRFWVSNVGDDEVSIAILLVNDAGKTTCLGPDGAFIIDQAGEPEDCYPTDLASVNAVNGTGDTHISIPAGFTGWAYYSIAPEDQIPWWEGTTMTADELLGVTQMRFDIRYPDATCMSYLILDEICLANED